MTLRLALATCAKYPTLTPDDQLLLKALREQGLEPVPLLWDDPAVRWDAFAAVLMRSPWDYYERAEEFGRWLDRLEQSRCRVLNPLPVLRRNLNKNYLREMQAEGFQTVPTAWLTKGDARPVAVQLADVAWAELVIKPTVSAGAYMTVRTTREALLKDPAPLAAILAHSDAMLQPFLPEILAEGEWSFLFFGGAFSHAVLKRAKAGDFRVQWVHGGTQAQAEPSPSALAGAARVLAAWPGPLPYARIDGIVQAGTGEFLLIEAELLEPHLFFLEAPGAAERFAAVIARAVGQGAR